MPHAIINGEVVELTEAEVREWEATLPAPDPNADIDAQILALEATVTNRRLREAALTEAGKAWLVEVDAQITTLRAQRT